MKEKSNKGAQHPRNIHRNGYDFEHLIEVVPALSKFIVKNKLGKNTIEFSNADAVLILNQALLKAYYKIDQWSIPKGFLCPAVPGRADYIHFIADLLSGGKKHIPSGNKINVLDIGTGANLIYPLLGNRIYGWNFLGSDIEKKVVEHASKIIGANKLTKVISVKHQQKKGRIFHGIVNPKDYFDLVMCNPPFHDSAIKAEAGTQRKWKKIGQGHTNKKNFGGQPNELIYPGGEITFIQRMIDESAVFGNQVFWFTTLVSKEDNLPKLQRKLDKLKVIDRKVIPMTQGNKQSRILAWTFLNQKQRSAWVKLRF